MDVRRKGFTLIELLIVVAIIAILALIAVPNFLEAQTRAKVSRVKADLRTLATGEEAYFVDWNSYTPGQGGRLLEGMILLTTPIAYVTTIPPEVFGGLYAQQSGGQTRGIVYELGSGDATTREPAGRSLTNPDLGMPSNVFMLESNGPDRYDDSRDDFLTGTFPWKWNADDPSRVAAASAFLYDPTNGTVSSGEILRFGGQKPGGGAYDLLWTQSSR
jgi:prepilin-type N-terminal cleavage/methylation domain-containing protein